MFNWLKKTANKAEDAIDQAKKDMSNTAEKVQQVLDDSSKSVNTIINIVLITLGISVLGNIVNTAVSVCKYKRASTPSSVTIKIENLYLGGTKSGRNE